MGADDAQIYNTYDDLLADPKVQAVSLCTPPNRHPEETIKAARAGKHILIEKAVANDPGSLGEMLRAVQEAA